jgi:hypothetical protein
MLGVAAGMALLMFRLPPIPQPAWYHQFADQRRWLGIPNFANVISNVAFALVGICGIVFIRRHAGHAFLDPRERWAYYGVFVGLLLTAFGSAYYHLVPNNARLVWDRLPMTIVFGSLVAALITERISVSAGLRLLPWLIAFGAGSVLQRYWRTNSTATAICAFTRLFRHILRWRCCLRSCFRHDTHAAAISPLSSASMCWPKSSKLPTVRFIC